MLTFEAPTPEQWWAAANKPRWLSLVKTLVLRNVNVFDSEGSHHASAEVFGVLSVDEYQVTAADLSRTLSGG